MKTAVERIKNKKRKMTRKGRKAKNVQRIREYIKIIEARMRNTEKDEAKGTKIKTNEKERKGKSEEISKTEGRGRKHRKIVNLLWRKCGNWEGGR